MSVSLSAGALRRANLEHDFAGYPTVQVLEVRKIQPHGAAPPSGDRWRVVINDSEFYQQAMLGTQLNPLVEKKELREGTIIKLKDFIINPVAQRRIMIILQVAIVGQGPALPPNTAPTPIGNPQNVETIVNQQPGGGGPGATATGPGGAMVNRAGPSAQVTPFASTPQAPSYLQKGGGMGGMGMGMGSTPIGVTPSSLNLSSFHPISSLNPYMNRWTIKARVTAKSEVRTWSNTRGQGRLFSVDLLDSQGGQIRATMFNDAVDKFEPMLHVDKVYLISKGQLKLANKKYSLINNEYEITLNADAEIQYVGEDASIETQKFSFNSIEEISRREENEFVDVIGVVINVQPISHIVSKVTQKELVKRNITLADHGAVSVEVTLWGEQAEKYNEEVLANHPILAIKNCKVSNFAGKTLNSSFQSQLFLNPDREESHRLKHWWDTTGAATVNSLTPLNKAGGEGGGGHGLSSAINYNDPRSTLSAIKDEKLGMQEGPSGETKADVITVKATISNLKPDITKPPWYYACPGPSCGKKVVPSGNEFFCEKCHKSYPSFECRYVLSLLAADFSGAEWLNAFNEQSTIILGHPAKDLLALQQAHDEAAFKQVFSNAKSKEYLFKIKVKAEMVNDERKPRCQVIGIVPIDYKQEAAYLLNEIDKYR